MRCIDEKLMRWIKEKWNGEFYEVEQGNKGAEDY